MTKEELELKISGLEKAIATCKDETSGYEDSLKTTQKQLKDLGKIALPPSVFDEIVDAIEQGISDFDFSDENNWDKDFGINYDGKVYLESLELRNSYELGEMIMDKISEIFTEMDAPEDDQVNNVTEVKKVI